MWSILKTFFKFWQPNNNVNTAFGNIKFVRITYKYRTSDSAHFYWLIKVIFIKSKYSKSLFINFLKTTFSYFCILLIGLLTIWCTHLTNNNTKEYENVTESTFHNLFFDVWLCYLWSNIRTRGQQLRYLVFQHSFCVYHLLKVS